ncbi:Tetratricopeptide repeat-containing protein [Hymenobacter daecheongensis DSM 21074]|uniref:histidine kinase n=1 Tax=Hymenobacter daecheongensis DSM 21074 TaxID=1121955 RepID=A0A1M6L6N0_9BACT|nr:ATP-binding protein [Hymenobacter daecheongensis]SHJ66719.1 Tetratricopeptide repeat-containing protein [Hymenobacter daecheongensis DSM 21074]
MKLPRTILLALSLALLAGPAPAQSRAADSLRRLLGAQPRPDTTRVRRLHALVLELAAVDAPQAIGLSQQALKLSRQLADTAGIGRSLFWLSILHRRQAEYDAARRYTLLARQLYARRHDRRREAKACLELSLIDLMQSNLTPALSWALQGLKLAEQAQDLVIQTQLRATIGSIYSKVGDYNSAIAVLQTTLRDGRRLGDQQVEAAALSSLASTYQLQQKWPQALRHYQQAVLVSRRMGDVKNETSNEIGLAEVYSLQGNQAQALRHGYRARALVRIHHDDYNRPGVELMLARSFLLSQRPDSAIALAGHALRLSQQSRSNGTISGAAKVLAQAHAEAGNFEEAYRYQSMFAAYQDTLAGEETQRKTSALRYGYELDKKQSQIALLNKTRQLQAQTSERQRQQLYALLAGLTGLLLLAGLLWRNVYIKQRANRNLNEKNAQIAMQRDDLTRALASLKAAQNQLIQREKMASLGELTAGIAHEIQNPLNFVNNFSEVSVELVAEFMEGPWQRLPESEKAYATELLDTLTENLQKITHHGHRADSIVKGMLQHSHTSVGHRETVDLNALVAENLPLAYQSFRAKNKSFHVKLTSDLDALVSKVAVVPQDIGRVLVNLYINSFYALQQRLSKHEAGYVPELVVHTKRVDHQVQIEVHDNGLGMSAEVQRKIFQPFFTTKPPGEGTGLGLSLSYDSIVTGHGGTLAVSSQEGQGTDVTICLPA